MSSKFLKQSTAATIMMGPYVSVTDGYTVQAALSFVSGVSVGVSGSYNGELT